ncbi:MAG TPA: dehydrogenase, partial [Verrucomicrobiota bacterium]|nr:dehydrogenase [Verrucomicrobiota bacterium]
MKTVLRLLFVNVIAFASIHAGAEEKKIVLIAGNPSHRSGEHEHRAGMLLFQKCLSSVPGVSTVVVSNGWPEEATVFEDAAAVVIYADGGHRHPALQGDALQTLAALNKRGVGFACIHYAVEPTIEKGQTEFLSWLGGCFEINWSVNPHWTADFKNLPEHPVTRGVKPFQLRDEWYYHMRFAEGMKGVTPVLSDVPSTNTLTRPD